MWQFILKTRVQRKMIRIPMHALARDCSWTKNLKLIILYVILYNMYTLSTYMRQFSNNNLVRIPAIIITPRACARGKAIGLYGLSVCRCRRCRCRHENRQISCLGICASSKHIKPISRFWWKTGLYALRIAQKGLLVLQIVHFLFSMPVVYRPHPLFSMLIILRMPKLNIGKGRHVIKLPHSVAIPLQWQSARGMCSTEL